MRAQEFFEVHWPGEVPRLRRLVARNGVPLQDVDDVVQETAARLYASWGRVFEDRPIAPLLTTIALNTARDYHRRVEHVARPVGVLPDAAWVEPSAVDRVALARLEVTRVGQALAGLPERARRTVVTAVAEELAGEQLGRERAPAATRMALSRARRQLAAATQLVGAAVGVVGRWTRRRCSSPVVPASALVALGVAVLAGVLLWPPVAPGAAAGSTRVPVSQVVTSAGDAGQFASAGRFGWTTRMPSLTLTPANVWFDGSGRWSTSPGWPLVSLGFFGGQAEVGPSQPGPTCRVGVAGLVTVTLRCPRPVTAR